MVGTAVVVTAVLGVGLAGETGFGLKNKAFGLSMLEFEHLIRMILQCRNGAPSQHLVQRTWVDFCNSLELKVSFLLAFRAAGDTSMLSAGSKPHGGLTS